MATVLADIMFRNCNSSLLRQHAGNQSFFSINVYRGAALGRCVALLWVEDGKSWYRQLSINPLNPELNPICYLLALLGAHHFLHVSRIMFKSLTLRLLMSYIYGAHILDVSRSHTTTQHSR